MNRPAASRETILAAAKKIAYSQGLSQVNIRKTAADCGIAVGTVYHYFSDKADLVVAILEDFWQQVLHGDLCATDEWGSYIAFCQSFYAKLFASLHTFERAFLQELHAQEEAIRARGRQMEERCFGHIKRGMLQVLQQDTAIPPQVWGGEFTREELVEFTFANMMAQLREGKPSCGFLLEVLRRAVYPTGQRP